MIKKRNFNIEAFFKRQLEVNNYIFVVFLFLTIIASVISIIGNFLTNYPLDANIKWVIAIAFSVMGFWLIRRDLFVETFKTIIFFAVQFLVIWPSWFMGGGDNLITILYMFLMAIEALLVFEKAILKWFMVIINMMSFIACILITYKFPHLIEVTHVTQNVFADSIIQISMIFILIAVSVNIYITSYRKQHLLLLDANASLEKAATIDELSQVYNRRKILERFGEIRNECKDKDIFVLMADVDRFKSINDIYGHQAGDKVIRYFASYLLKNLGQEAIGRYGGDEFIVFFSHVKEENLACVLEKIILIPPLDNINLTMSAGIAKLMPGQSDKDVIHAADELLLQAKRDGRNQIKMYNGNTIKLNN